MLFTFYRQMYHFLIFKFYVNFVIYLLIHGVQVTRCSMLPLELVELRLLIIACDCMVKAHGYEVNTKVMTIYVQVPFLLF